MRCDTAGAVARQTLVAHRVLRRAGYETEFCFMSVRGNPLFGEQPDLLAWPTTAAQVARLVAFAGQHNLCMSVAGTGAWRRGSVRQWPSAGLSVE